jgi:hypothetical protein
MAMLCVPAAWTLFAFVAQLLTRNSWLASSDRAAQALGAFVLFALLPALGAAHLVYLSKAGLHKAIAA